MGKKSSPQGYPLMRLFVVPRPLRKGLFCQLICCLVIIWLWFHFNGGLIPTFLRPDASDFMKDRESNVLLYFSESNNDASRIKWARAVNDHAELQAVLQSDVHIVEADISLKGQGTDKQQLVPVMAQPPDIDSDITFNVWANQIVASNKAIKLHFHSVDAVEITLNALNSRLKGTRRPIWLHADVLRGPHSNVDPIGTYSQVNPIDGTLFIRSVSRLFPYATISLGWTTGTHTDLSQSGYTWSNVMDMYDFIEMHGLLKKQPLTISVRLSLVENSVLQLKWLCDSTDASLTIFHSEDDEPTKMNMMYAAFRFAPDKLFFDLNHSELDKYLKSYRHFSKERINPLVHERDTVAFRPKAWLKVGYHKFIKAIMASEDTAVLFTPDVHLLTKSKFQPSEKIRLFGRVMFIDRANTPAEKTSGLHLFFRTSQISNPDDLIGLRVFIGVLGDVTVEAIGLDGITVKEHTTITPSSSFCYRFGIINAEKNLNVKVAALDNCESLKNFRETNKFLGQLNVAIPEFGPTDKRPVAIKVVDRTRAAVIDQLIIEYAADGAFTHPL